MTETTTGRRRTTYKVLVGLALLAAAAIYGPWTAATVRCGHQPVQTSNFAAGSTYHLPGETGYGRFWLFNGYVCSAEQAEDGGYHHG